MDELSISVDQTQGWIGVVELPLHQLLPLPSLYPVHRAIAALQHRRYRFYRHYGIGELLLLPRLVEKVLCKPLQVLQAEVAEPLEVLPAEHAAFLLPVLLLVELGGGVGVVEFPVHCARDNVTPEVVDFFGGGDDLELVDELELLLPPFVLEMCKDLFTSIMENGKVIAFSNAYTQSK